MKTLKKLSNKKLDQLTERVREKYWALAHTAPHRPPPNMYAARRMRGLEIKITRERLRRAGL